MFVPNPIAFTVLGLEVRWYGILIAVGMVLGTLVMYRRAEKHVVEPEKVLDFIIAGIPAGVIGARIYYVIFNWSYYVYSNGSPAWGKIVNLSLGGLAIHGGLILGFTAVILLCIYNKYNAFNVLDLAAPGIALAQSIGRWGNFFNSEAHGGPTDLPWGIWVDGEMVHPTFLYESVWCAMLFVLLIYIDNRRKFTGQIILLYAFLYSIERFFVEGLRTDSLMLGPLKQAQVMSLAVILLSGATYLYLRGKKQTQATSQTDQKHMNQT